MIDYMIESKCIICNDKSRFCFLDSNNHTTKYSSFDYLAAFGVKKKCSPKKNIFNSKFCGC